MTCCCSVAQSCLHVATPWTVVHQASLSFIISWRLLRFMSIELVVPSNRLILCHPLLLLPSIFLSIRSFLVSWLFTSGGQSSGASASHQSFQWIFTGFISFRTEWFVLLAVQGTRVFSNITVWKHQFFSAQPSLWSNSHTHTWLLEKLCCIFSVRSPCPSVLSKVFYNLCVNDSLFCHELSPRVARYTTQAHKGWISFHSKVKIYWSLRIERSFN